MDRLGACPETMEVEVLQVSYQDKWHPVSENLLSNGCFPSPEGVQTLRDGSRWL